MHPRGGIPPSRGTMNYSLTSAWRATLTGSALQLCSEFSRITIELPAEKLAAVDTLLRGWDSDSCAELEPLRAELVRRGILRARALSPTPAQDRQIEYWRAFTDDALGSIERLRASTVTIVGVGGIGSVALQHFVGAGVASFRLLDSDVVETSNLNRQFLYDIASVGTPKVEAARAYVLGRSPDAMVSTRTEKWRPESSHLRDFLFSDVDFVIAAIDKPTIGASVEVVDAAWNSGVASILAASGLEKSFVSQVFAPGRSPLGPRASLVHAPHSSDSSLLASHGPTNTLPGTVAADQAIHHLASLCDRVDYARPLVIVRSPDGAFVPSRVDRLRL